MCSSASGPAATARCVQRSRGALTTEQAAARTETPAPWTDRLPELAARQLDGDTAGSVIA